MTISVFDLFTIGIGPSSSHTVGPMRAARRFVDSLADEGVLAQTAQVRVELFGSLGHTGKGHGSDRAVLLGLSGETPETIDPDTIEARLAAIRAGSELRLRGERAIPFREAQHLIFNRRETLPLHANGMRFSAFVADGAVLATRVYYSIGGGFVVDEDESGQPRLRAAASDLPYPFHSGADLLRLGNANGLRISDLLLANERTSRDDGEIEARLRRIWQAMHACIARGCRTAGELPGGMRVARRAPDLHRQLVAQTGHDFVAGPHSAPETRGDGLLTLDWVNLFALAVNEENAAGGRVVTAPTNGAAGIVPAVLHYYRHFCAGANDEGVGRFLLTAAAIGVLYKENASISGAEVGCQGEVGVACSMAAGALAEVLGGSLEQVENAAEIGMEHNLGLTCDPIGGLVQIPCIERNAMGAVKAINAARMALRGDGRHRVSLDKVIVTMRQTGADMSSKYKETSRGGLAVNVIEC